MRYLGLASALLCAVILVGCDANQPATAPPPDVSNPDLAPSLELSSLELVLPAIISEVDEDEIIQGAQIKDHGLEIRLGGAPRTLHLWTEASRPGGISPYIKHTAAWAYPKSPTPSFGNFNGNYELKTSGKRTDDINFPALETLCGMPGVGEVRFDTDVEWRWLLFGVQRKHHIPANAILQEICESPV